MNLIASISSSPWAAGFRHVNCAKPGCNRWLTQRHLSARPVGVTIRDAWYCSYRCAVAPLEERFRELMPTISKSSARSPRMPLGLMCVGRGWITEEQLRIAKERQQQIKGDMGAVLLGLGFASEEQITAARSSLWNCPVYTLPPRISRSGITLPSTLMQAYSAVPMQSGPSTGLFIGFLDRVDYGLLYAVEQVTGCKTTPCFLTPTAHRAFTESHSQFANELTYEDGMTAQQMTRIASQHGARVNANAVVVVRCGDYIWARLNGGSKTEDLLFHVS